MTRCRYSTIYEIPESMPVFFVHSRPSSWNSCPATVHQVTLADGTPVKVNNLQWDYRAALCLRGLQIRVMDSEINVDFYNIDFKCMSPHAKKPTDRMAQIQKCLERMRDHKCPYRLARGIYTGPQKGN